MLVKGFPTAAPHTACIAAVTADVRPWQWSEAVIVCHSCALAVCLAVSLTRIKSKQDGLLCLSSGQSSTALVANMYNILRALFNVFRLVLFPP
jgi:hypothetical protein